MFLFGKTDFPKCLINSFNILFSFTEQNKIKRVKKFQKTHFENNDFLFL